jgi:4-amino-4-deoxy-L-arabinose transferase-like glycosyltransferase
MTPYLPTYFSSKAITIYIILLVTCTVAFGRILPFAWIVFGLLEVALFFKVSSSLTKSWSNSPEKHFAKRLFRLALSIRLVYVIFMYFFYQFMTGEPFEFEAGDSKGYHALASWIVDMIQNGDLSDFYTFIGINYSDAGYPMYLGILYTILGKSIFLIRILKAIIGAYTCVLIYRLASRNFDETTGRIAGILAILSPTLIYYCGLHLKETEMVFLTVLAMERFDYFLRSKNFDLNSILVFSIAGLSLFFFRTVLGAAFLFAVVTAVLFSPNRIVKLRKKIVLYIWGGGVILIMLGGVIKKNIDQYIEMSETNQDLGMLNRSTRQDGNKLASYGSSAIFAPIILIGPLPTLVNIDTQQNQMLLNGGYFVRNMLAFFLFLSLFVLFKQSKIGEASLLISFIFTYLAILAMSTFALSERFHLPAVPFIIILASYGITQIKLKHKKRYIIFLVFLSVLIIGWNWFKLAGRA